MKKNNKKGFTLVELVIVVAVMAVLVAVAIPTVKSVVGTAEDAVAESNARTIESMIKLELAEQTADEGSTAALTGEEIQTALAAAQLGIDAGTYYYDADTGMVTTTSGGDYTITFTSGVPAVSPET